MKKFIVLGRISLFKIFSQIGSINIEKFKKFKGKLLANEVFEDFIYNFTKKSLIKEENEEANLKYDLFHRIKKNFNAYFIPYKKLLKPLSLVEFFDNTDNLFIKGFYLDSIAPRVLMLNADGEVQKETKIIKRNNYDNDDSDEEFDFTVSHTMTINKETINKEKEDISKKVTFNQSNNNSKHNTIDDKKQTIGSISKQISKNPSKGNSKNVSQKNLPLAQQSLKVLKQINNQSLSGKNLIDLVNSKKIKEEPASYFYIEEKEYNGEILPFKISPFDKNVKNIDFETKIFKSTSLLEGIIQTFESSKRSFEKLNIFGSVFYYFKINEKTKITLTTKDSPLSPFGPKP